MSDEELKQEAREKANQLEENQTLGIYDRDEDLEYDKGWNAGEVSGYEDGYYDGAKRYFKDYEETEALLDKQIEATLKLYKENAALKADKAEAQNIIRELIEIIEPLGNFSGGVFDRAKDLSKADK